MIFRFRNKVFKFKIISMDAWLMNWLKEQNNKGIGYIDGDLEEMNENIRVLKLSGNWDKIKNYDPVSSLGREIETYDFNDPAALEAIKQQQKDLEEWNEGEVDLPQTSESTTEKKEKGKVDLPQENNDVLSGEDLQKPEKLEDPEIDPPPPPHKLGPQPPVQEEKEERIVDWKSLAINAMNQINHGNLTSIMYAANLIKEAMDHEEV